MANTSKGIYYPSDYYAKADIPEDLKKMAESIDEVIATGGNEGNMVYKKDGWRAGIKYPVGSVVFEKGQYWISLDGDTTSRYPSEESEYWKALTKDWEKEIKSSAGQIKENESKLKKNEENISDIIDLIPKVSNKGESITLENTARAKFTKFRIEGNSSQETRSGKNKIIFDDIKETVNQGITCSIKKRSHNTKWYSLWGNEFL